MEDIERLLVQLINKIKTPKTGAVNQDGPEEENKIYFSPYKGESAFVSEPHAKYGDEKEANVI